MFTDSGYAARMFAKTSIRNRTSGKRATRENDVRAFVRTAFSLLVAATLAFGVLPTTSAVAGSLSLAELTSQATQRIDGEFNTSALPSKLPSEMGKWKGAVSAIHRDEDTLERCLESPDACTSQALSAWRQMMQSASGHETMEMLRIVNRFFNSWRYRSDLESYGEADHWAAPIQFMARSGDCEDFAIAKFVSLMLLGVPERTLKIVVVVDESRQIGHAVLSFSTGNQMFILDSLFDEVVRDHEIDHYRPVFSMNFSSGWIHMPRGQNEDFNYAGNASHQNQIALLNRPIGE